MKVGVKGQGQNKVGKVAFSAFFFFFKSYSCLRAHRTLEKKLFVCTSVCRPNSFLVPISYLGVLESSQE